MRATIRIPFSNYNLACIGLCVGLDLISHTKLEEIHKITFIWFTYTKKNPRYCLMTRTYISSNSCTLSDIDFWFDLHCKAQVATAHMQRNLRSLAWNSLLYISYHQRSNSASLKTFESSVICINVLNILNVLKIRK